MTPIKNILPLILVSTLAACASNAPNPSTQSPAATQDTSQGLVWRTDSGKTLYTFAKDSQVKSNCYGPCAEKWPPFIAAKNTLPSGDFGLITRQDSSQQWTLKGLPLYTWIKDQQAGDTTGHGVKNIWFVARADDVPVKVYLNQGASILTDNSQNSLYTFDKDASGESNCYQKCATLWPPLMATEHATASGPFSIVKRKDGGWQWALDGSPLYRWVKDTQPGQTSGDGVKGVWHLATVVK
ncbi:MAG: hypothetical protein V7629_01125 [Motiliproteus sp.]